MDICSYIGNFQSQESNNQDMTRNLLVHLHNLMKENEKLRNENRRLKKHCRIDPLTGINNRLFMEEYLTEELNRSDRYNSSFSLIIIDIDHFKSINDTYGHQAGDTVIRKIASILKNNIRKCDQAFRYGGEEFLIALPETDLAGAEKTADKIRKIVERELFDGVDRTVTVSMGISEKGDDNDVATLINVADKALYEAKRGGRNQVRSAA